MIKVESPGNSDDTRTSSVAFAKATSVGNGQEQRAIQTVSSPPEYGRRSNQP
jgi:hypothetical protein